MKRLLSIFTFCCLLSIIAFAQAYLPHTRMHFKISPTTPSWPWGNITNNTDGTLPYAWYVAQYYYTNGSTVVLPDLYTNALHLTNSATASKWPVYNSTLAGGAPALRFDGVGTYLKSVLFTNNLAQDIFIVMFENGSPSSKLYIDSTDAVNRHYIAIAVTVNLVYGVGNDITLLNGKVGISNRWVVLECKYAANSLGEILTNNVIGVTKNPDTFSATMQGITIGAKYDLSGSPKFDFAEAVFYSYTNNVNQRSNIYAYLTNKYSIQ